LPQAKEKIFGSPYKKAENKQALANNIEYTRIDFFISLPLEYRQKVCGFSHIPCQLSYGKLDALVDPYATEGQGWSWDFILARKWFTIKMTPI